VSTPALYISHEPGLDWLTALPVGTASDGQPGERWRELSDRFRFYLDPESGREVGFTVGGFAGLDVDDPALGELWTGPRFSAPLLGLVDVPAAEIVLAARAHFGSVASVNRHWFNAALDRTGEEALHYWTHCLESGDPMAHFALGYTLCELGRHHEAYRHLRYYTELAPAQPWVWRWFGQAAEALGEVEEARHAYQRAVQLTDEGWDETDAGELLAELGV